MRIVALAVVTGLADADVSRVEPLWPEGTSRVVVQSSGVEGARAFGEDQQGLIEREAIEAGRGQLSARGQDPMAEVLKAAYESINKRNHWYDTWQKFDGSWVTFMGEMRSKGSLYVPKIAKQEKDRLALKKWCDDHDRGWQVSGGRYYSAFREMWERWPKHWKSFERDVIPFYTGTPQMRAAEKAARDRAVQPHIDSFVNKRGMQVKELELKASAVKVAPGLSSAGKRSVPLAPPSHHQQPSDGPVEQSEGWLGLGLGIF